MSAWFDCGFSLPSLVLISRSSRAYASTHDSPGHFRRLFGRVAIYENLRRSYPPATISLLTKELHACVITGDGAVGFNIMELETAAREQVIVVIVAVDDAWGMEKTAFIAQGLGPRDWANRGIEIGPVRYDGVAQSMGCHGEYVDQVDQLQPALERAVQSGKPAVIHVQVDRDLNTKPPGWEQFRKARAVRGY